MLAIIWENFQIFSLQQMHNKEHELPLVKLQHDGTFNVVLQGHTCILVASKC